MPVVDVGLPPEAMGKDILNNIIMGTGVGASATGLYYLAKKLRRQFEENIERNKPHGPDYADVPMEVPALPAPAQKKLAADASTTLDMVRAVGAPLVGSAAGAILAAATSKAKNKKRNALIGAGLGGLAGLGANTKPVHEFLGGTVPDALLPVTKPIFGDTWVRGGATQRAWRAAANIGGASAGILGGKALYDLAVQPEIDKQKEKRLHGGVESARKEYFDALLQKDEDNEKKSSVVDQFLDAGYAAYEEKTGGLSDIGSGLYNTAGSVMKTVGDVATLRGLRDLAALTTVAATVGGGALGAKYMYDKTTNAAKAKNMAKALAARERMQHMPPVWIDPRELADIKQVSREESDKNRGV